MTAKSSRFVLGLLYTYVYTSITMYICRQVTKIKNNEQRKHQGYGNAPGLSLKRENQDGSYEGPRTKTDTSMYIHVHY